MKPMLLILFVLSSALYAASGAGNGAFDYGVSFTLNQHHPQYDFIKKRLKEISFPKVFVDILLDDLEKVKVLWSGEKITLADFTKRNQLVLRELVRETTSNQSGQVEQVLERETFDVVDLVNDLGIYLEASPRIRSNFKDGEVILMAATEVMNNQVIYFSAPIDKLTKRKQVELTLHEQFHRLEILFNPESSHIVKDES